MTANAMLHARHLAAAPRGIINAFLVYAQRAEGAKISDADRNRHVDSAGGIAILSTGHRHPAVMAAVAKQLEADIHTAFHVFPYEPYVSVSDRLNGLAPFGGPAKSVLFSTGAEAVENTIKTSPAETGLTGEIPLGCARPVPKPEVSGKSVSRRQMGKTRADRSSRLKDWLPVLEEKIWRSRYQ